jgi:poly(A) polymerase
MRLRADIGEVDETLADWWQEFSMADDNLRQDLVDQVREERQQKPKMVRAPRPMQAAVAGAEPADHAPEAHAPGGAGEDTPGQPADAPKKRRRRRRPGGANTAPGQDTPRDSGDNVN